MSDPMLFVKSCPVCGNGLCRIRVSVIHQRVQGFVVCDECEAIWANPSMVDRVLTTNDECEVCCPGTEISIWDEKTHWANVGEICLLGWFDQIQWSLRE